MNAFVNVLRSAYVKQLRMRSGLYYTVGFYCIILVCWGAIWWAAIGASGGTIHGYSYERIYWYIAGTEAAVVCVSSRRIEAIGDDIAAGMIEVEMLRPASVVTIRIARQTGESFACLTFVAIAALVMGVLYTHEVPDPVTVAFAIPALMLAVACNAIALYVFASLAFWIRDARAAWFLFQKCIFLPGGMLLPVQLMPHALRSVVWFLPFWTMAYAPGRLVAGFHEPILLVGQCVWLVVLFGLARMVFAFGERRVQAGVV